MLDAGVKADDVLAWAAVLANADVAVEQLAESLGEYVSIGALMDAQQESTSELQSEATELAVQVEALTQERDHVHDAIVAVKEWALREVEEVEQRAKAQVDSLIQEASEFGQLRAEAAELGELVQSARLLKSGDPAKWMQLSPEVIRHLLMIAVRWTGEPGRDRQVPAPEAVRQTSSLLRYTDLRLSQVLLWALAGLFTEAERQELAPSR